MSFLAFAQESGNMESYENPCIMDISVFDSVNDKRRLYV